MRLTTKSQHIEIWRNLPHLSYPRCLALGRIFGVIPCTIANIANIELRLSLRAH